MCFPLEISNPDSTRYLKSSSFFNFDQLIATSPCNSWLIFHLFGKILFNPLKEKRDQMKCTFGINDRNHSYGFTTPIAGKRSSSLVYDLHLFSWWRKELALGHRCCADKHVAFYNTTHDHADYITACPSPFSEKAFRHVYKWKIATAKSQPWPGSPWIVPAFMRNNPLPPRGGRFKLA